MRELGFSNNMAVAGPLCRWRIEFEGSDLIVDAMPANSDVLGFTNRWYSRVMETAWEKEISSGLNIRIVDPVYFLGTKFEAWKGRGNNDIFSHDLEDIFYVLEHRGDIEKDIFSAPEDIKEYLGKEFTSLLSHPDLYNSLPGMVVSGHEDLVLSRIGFISKKST